MRICSITLALVLTAVFAYGLWAGAMPYFINLGEDFWKIVAVYVFIFAWAILWMRTRKGPVHWIGIVLIALGAMLDAIPGWIKDSFVDAIHRFPAAARARLVELPRSE